MMRIVIDLQGAQNGSRHRGIGRYVLSLSKAIVRNRGNHEIFILLNGLFPDTIEDIKKSFFGILPDHHIIIFYANGPVDELPTENFWRVKAAELLREQFINDISPDILLIGSLFEGACDNTVTSIGQLFSEVPTAVILYDLIPYMDPQKYIGWGPSRDWYYRKIESLKRSNLLLSISDSSRQEAIDHLNIDSRQIVNIQAATELSCSPDALMPDNRLKALKHYGIKKKFLMHASAFDERKNFEGLIKAFGALPNKLRKSYQLVLVCGIDEVGRQSLNNIADQVGLGSDDLVLTGFVSDNVLAVLYSECHLFVFPSFHEGFGLPALEAMSYGSPTIGSNTTSIPEVIGRDDALFDPKSTQSMTAHIEKVLTDSDFWQTLKEHAISQSKKFSWDQCAKTTIEAFENLLQQSDTYRKCCYDQNKLPELVEKIGSTVGYVQPTEQDLILTAESIAKNENTSQKLISSADFGGRITWRIEGPFDSSYSLALLNRETARALDKLGHFVVLHSTEGPGDFLPNPEFLKQNPDLALMNERVLEFPQAEVDVTSRNLYPPRVDDMKSPFNLLHHYAWEESGFPPEWVNNFNANLHGVTCLSNHVEKILIDNGVSVPISTSGCGVDHWEKIYPKQPYNLEAKEFRFLHVSSCFPRKGVDLLLDAYGKVFTSDDNVSLIIKTFENQHNEIHKWLKERKMNNGRFPHVVIIEADLEDSELKALYQECHVLVSPSRAEGFGLPIAEAMLSGLSVITTAWGGQLDFCNKSNAWLVDYQFERAKTHFGLFSSVWARVDIEELSIALKQSFHSTKEQLSQKAMAGRNLLLENFKWVDVAGRASNAFNIWRTTRAENPEVRIGWITTWNTKCGIATYSEHLISHMPNENVTVFAPETDKLIKPDEDRCIRSWCVGKDKNELSGLNAHIKERRLNVIVIQFNYGFYNFFELGKFIEDQLSDGMIVIVMLHSTIDPYGETKNLQLSELQPALLRCQRILVHSVPDLNRLKAIGLVDNVALFPHGVLNFESLEINKQDSLLPMLASYGFCLPHKGLTELVEAVAILKSQDIYVRLRMVNAEYPDPISTDIVNKLRRLISERGIEDLVEMNNDFLGDKESFELLSEADLLVYPYQETGESASGAVRYGLATKHPVAVTPLSIFEDLGDAVFRFRGTTPQEIAEGIREYLNEISLCSDNAKFIASEAQRWRDAHDYAAISKRLFNICVALLRKHPQRKYRFHGSNYLLKTAVGKIQGGNVVSTGVAGYLLFGPYIALNAGEYRIVIQGALGTCGAAGALVDIAIDKGTCILAETTLDRPDVDGCLASIQVSLDKPCTDLEIRVWVDAVSDITISLLEILPSQHFVQSMPSATNGVFCAHC